MSTIQANGRPAQLSLYLTTYSAQDPGGWQHACGSGWCCRSLQQLRGVTSTIRV
ncbi:MAG TPA: hypothetical protein VM282_27610 [Acidimicrobiales bacterium]|nr:hypothetical protein [Acidimicrobiales bacterium]